VCAGFWWTWWLVRATETKKVKNDKKISFKKVKNDKKIFLQRNVTKFFFPQKESVVDAFKNFEGSEEEKNSMQGYITRAKMTDKAHASLGGINVVPDEDNKTLPEAQRTQALLL